MHLFLYNINTIKLTMDSGYGQFVYLDENSNLEDDNMRESIIVKDNYTSLKNNFNDSILIMFVGYVCNLIEYFYEK